jgi:Putative Flp pilus-assembly TadE/G-like
MRVGKGLRRDERAGVTLVAAALIPVMLITGVVLHDVAAIYGARGRAQTAADAAAKAAGLELSPYFGVGCDPQGAAADYAARNGAQLQSCSLGGRDAYLWVTVRVSSDVELLLIKGGNARVTATARCYLDLAPPAGSGGTNI